METTAPNVSTLVMPGLAGPDAAPTSTAVAAMEVSSASQSADGSGGEAAKIAKPAAVAGAAHVAAASAPQPAPPVSGARLAPVREAQSVTRGWLVTEGDGATRSAAGAAITYTSDMGPAAVPEEDGSASSDECVIVD